MCASSKPSVKPFTPGLDLRGKTAIITRASSGQGLENTRQLLALHIQTVILALRNVTEGEKCRRMLLADIAANSTSKRAIKVTDVDMSDYNRVKTFTAAARTEVPVVSFLVLTAGFGIIRLERSPTGHVSMMRINYLSKRPH